MTETLCRAQQGLARQAEHARQSHTRDKDILSLQRFLCCDRLHITIKIKKNKKQKKHRPPRILGRHSNNLIWLIVFYICVLIY